MDVRDVIVVGAGPTGLALANELALAGASVTVLEQLAERLEQTKGGAVQPRTAELLDARGLLDAVHAAAIERPEAGGHFAGLPVPLDCGAWQSATPCPISLQQWRLEEILEDAAVAHGAVIRRGAGVCSVEPDQNGVAVRTDGPDGPAELRARYLVGCDGAHSVVRKQLALPFPGRPGTFRAVLADITLTAVSDLVPVRAGHFSDLTRYANDRWGMLVPVGGQRYRFTTDAAEGDPAEVLQAALTAVYGEPTTLGEIHTLSTFTDATRQLVDYRHGRVLFAGDAAHIHPPFGGQGLNLGVQDAINLGWKLAGALAGWAPAGLLDTYQAERHPVAARVLHHTAAQRVLFNPAAEPDVAALREIVTDLLRIPEANSYVAGMMSGLDAPGRVPDVPLATEAGPVRLFELLRPARPLLIDTGDTPALADTAAAAWADRVDLVRATAPAGFRSVLLRPDGVAAWTAGTGSLTETLASTFGPAPVPAL